MKKKDLNYGTIRFQFWASSETCHRSAQERFDIEDAVMAEQKKGFWPNQAVFF